MKLFKLKPSIEKALEREWSSLLRSHTGKKLKNVESEYIIKEVLLDGKFKSMIQLTLEEWIYCMAEGFIRNCISKDCVVCEKYWKPDDNYSIFSTPSKKNPCRECPLTRKAIFTNHFPNVRSCESKRSPYAALRKTILSCCSKITDKENIWWKVENSEFYISTDLVHRVETENLYNKFMVDLESTIVWIEIKMGGE